MGTEVISSLFTVITAWFLADILSGVIHWLQDSYLTENTFNSRFFAEVSRDNDRHHKYPWLMSQTTVWHNINDSVIIGFPLSFGLFMIGSPTILWLAILFGSYANAIHRYAHSSKRPKLVRLLQHTGIFMSNKHHREHHYNDKKHCPKNLHQ